jgi:hypothetical protein
MLPRRYVTIKIAERATENLTKFRHLEKPVRNKNVFHDEIK